MAMTEAEQNRRLAGLLRAMAKATIDESVARARTTNVLAGTVEDMSDDLDVVWARLDGDATSGDPTQSDNFEAPGIIPTTRMGETFRDEQVRVTFEGPAGANAQRTSIPHQIVVPYGAESGTARIIIDGDAGSFTFLNELDEVVAYWDPTQLRVGIEGSAQARLDPLGGLRLRDVNDILRVLLSASEGLTLRDPTTGLSTLIARWDRLVSLDPVTGDQILIGSGVSSAVPTPRWASVQSSVTGPSINAPAIASFKTNDDFDLRFACASAPSELGATTWTTPASHTERSDASSSGDGLTLATVAATKDPADLSPVGALFASSSSSMTRRNAHSVIVRGGGGTSPAYRSVSTSSFVVSDESSIEMTIPAPASIVEGDVLVAFVAIAGSSVPVSWSVPTGWSQLGVQIAGLGTSHVLGSGIWWTRCPALPPASETVTINLPANPGTTKVHATVVAISDPFANALTGLDIRVGSQSLPRGRVRRQTLTANSSLHTGDVTTDFALTDVPMLAGRTYEIELRSTVQWASVATAAEWHFIVRIDGVDYARLLTWAPGNSGTSRWSWRYSLDYTPGADGLYDIDIRADEIVNGADITFQATASVPRYLTVNDAGGTF